MDSNFCSAAQKPWISAAFKRTPQHLSATEKVPMTTSDKILISNCIAIFLTPVAALWIGGILQRRSDGYLTSAGGPGAAVAVGRRSGCSEGEGAT